MLASWIIFIATGFQPKNTRSKEKEYSKLKNFNLKITNEIFRFFCIFFYIQKSHQIMYNFFKLLASFVYHILELVTDNNPA